MLVGPSRTPGWFAHPASPGGSPGLPGSGPAQGSGIGDQVSARMQVGAPSDPAGHTVSTLPVEGGP